MLSVCLSLVNLSQIFGLRFIERRESEFISVRLPTSNCLIQFTDSVGSNNAMKLTENNYDRNREPMETGSQKNWREEPGRSLALDKASE